jgi:protein-S-isoprenylcysteine O-methyltransferase Ste14
VPCGFLVAGLYAMFCRPTPPLAVAGLLVALAGLALRAWAAGHLAKNEALATSGPFAYTRNPLYLGTLIAAAGFALAGRAPWLAALFGLYFLALFLPVIGEEESHLCKLFPAYAEYAARVPRLLPRLPRVSAGDGRFQWTLYLRNREYQALAGYLAGAVVLASKLI